MNPFHSLAWQRMLAGGAAGLLLLSSTALAAPRVSPPPRPFVGKQIVRPGETIELMKQHARAHSNKVRNKVTAERALAASVNNVRPAEPLQPQLASQPTLQAELDVASTRSPQRSDWEE